MDDDVDRAYLRLMDAICSWERATGRDVTVAMIPHTLDYLDELLNVEASKAERWILALRLADEITDHRFEQIAQRLVAHAVVVPIENVDLIGARE